MQNNHPSQNATKHGCCSETVILLDHENLADYEAPRAKVLDANWQARKSMLSLRPASLKPRPSCACSAKATWFKAYNPKSDAEKRIVQQLVNADWLSERATRALLHFESQLFKATPNPSDWTEDQLKRLALLTRYQTARANSVIKARKTVEDYRKTRLNEVFKIEKFQFYKEKHKIHKDRYSNDIAALMKEMHQSDNDLVQLRQQLTDLMK